MDHRFIRNYERGRALLGTMVHNGGSRADLSLSLSLSLSLARSLARSLALREGRLSVC
jgi:hypothetical protein